MSDCVRDIKDLEIYQVTKFVPFDPVGKRTESDVADAQCKALRFTKGAPLVVIDLCGLDGDTKAKAQQTVADLAAKGKRALGVAESTDAGKSWSFLGILSMLGPPRDDSKSTIQKAKKHGLRVKMVTGDDIAGGHLLPFVMRSRETTFSRPWPAMPLLLAIVGTQIFAVLMCDFGWFVTALPWTIIGLVWRYMLVRMAVLD